MLSIADLVTFREKRSKVMVGGKEIEIRILTMKDRARAEIVAGAMPVPPLKANPNKGSMAPLEPDERDPDYLRGRQQWLRRLATAQVALMTDYQTAAMQQSQRTTATDDDVKAAVEELLDVLPEEVVECLVDRQGEMVRGEEPNQHLKN